MSSQNTHSSLSQNLLAQWKQARLGHFYIINTAIDAENISHNNQQLAQWAKEFLIEVLQSSHTRTYQQASQQLAQGHSDILWITPQKSNSYNLKSGEFEQLYRTQSYRAMELEQHFVVVEQAHLITEVLANKLLKELESPQVRTTVFFLNPSQKSFLPTLNSRAITLSIDKKSTTQQLLTAPEQPIENLEQLQKLLQKWKDSISEQLEPEDKSCLEFLSQLAEKAQQKQGKEVLAWGLNQLNSLKLSEETLQYWWLSLEEHKQTSFGHRVRDLSTLQWMEKMRVFRNPLTTRQSEIITQLLSW